MILFNRDLLMDEPMAFVVLMAAVAVALLIGITFHEFSHAWAASKQGDLTATRLGRLTLNPKAHLDPIGTVMLLVAGFGWGRPVPVNPMRLRNGRRGMAFVSAAGPFSNVLLVGAFSLLFQSELLSSDDLSGALQSTDPIKIVTLIAWMSIRLNLILAAFNLIPLAPLDGGGILTGIVPREWLPAVSKLQRMGPLIMIALVASTFLTNLNPLGFIFGPVLDLVPTLTTPQFR
jgi:Zn-dependent protease